MNRRTFSVAEAARILGIGRNSGYAAVRSGELAAIRIGKRLVVPRSALEHLLGEQLTPESEAVAMGGNR